MKKGALFASFLLLLSAPAAAFQVMGSGTVTTIPVWKTNTTTLGDTSPIDATASQNLFITGPSPWLDVKSATYGALGDTQVSPVSASMANNSTTFTASSAIFASTDVGKAIAINNAPAAPPSLTAASCGSGGAIPAGVTIYYRLTVFNLAGEGTPSFEGVFTTNASSCNFTIPTPTTVSGTAWNVYAVESVTPATIAADGTCSGGTGTAGACRISGTTVQITTTSAHNFVKGQTALITGVSDSSFDGAFVITSVPSTTTFQYSQIGTANNHGGNGTVGSYGSASGYEELQSGSGAGCSATKMITFSQRVGDGSMTGCNGASGVTWTTGSSTAITLSGTAAPPAPSVSIGTITAFGSSTSVTVSFTSPNKIPSGNTWAFGHDDTSKIQSALNSAACAGTTSVGCKLFFPPGSYWVQSPGLSIPTGQPFNFLMGAGASSSKSLSAGPVGLVSGTSEIVTPDAIYPLVVGTSGGAALNAGPRISNIAFRDISGVGNALGGVHFNGVAHAFLDNLALIDFANGAGITFDTTGGGSAFNQYNYLLDLTALDVKTPILFLGGTASSNWIEAGNLVGSQLGGGACIDFQPFAGNSSGHNYIHYPQCNYFPTGMHLFDQNTDDVFFHAENTAQNGPGGSGSGIIGSAPTGTGLLIEATLSGNCIDNQIAQTSFTSFVTGINVSTTLCSHTVITSPAYSNISTHLSDSGTNTQTIGGPPDAQNNLTFAGSGSSEVQYFTVGTAGVTGNTLVCFSAAFTVITCGGTGPIANFVGITPISASQGTVIGVQIAGIATLTLDGARGTTALGDLICSSSTASDAGEGTDIGHAVNTTCPTGQGIGIIAQTISTTSTVVFLARN